MCWLGSVLFFSTECKVSWARSPVRFHVKCALQSDVEQDMTFFFPLYTVVLSICN